MTCVEKHGCFAATLGGRQAFSRDHALPFNCNVLELCCYEAVHAAYALLVEVKLLLSC